MEHWFPGPGLKRLHPGSESRSNKPPEPIISQIIDKLKHINQPQLSSRPKPPFFAAAIAMETTFWSGLAECRDALM
ncbi:glypican-3 [Lates japonicus]|uniref:Glypican-3 n=1 Tax=Lates japonicus TaxID=270547 RepID=A0AAD3NJL5_LATJO|nr:glypican-3 [Lates japonicus]